MDNRLEKIIHAVDHFEPAFIAELKNERETWIADNMRYEIVSMLRARQKKTRNKKAA